MKKFSEWCEDKLNEMGQMGQDPLISAMNKIKAAEKQGLEPYGRPWADRDVAGRTFGLDDKEIQAMKDHNILVTDPNAPGGGSGVDQKAFDQMLYSLNRQAQATMPKLGTPPPQQASQGIPTQQRPSFYQRAQAQQAKQAQPPMQ